MMAALVTTEGALTSVARSLRIPAPGPSNGLTPQLLAQAIRRAILAPCPRHELERAVRASFVNLGSDGEELRTLVEATLDSLLAFGEILEMRSEPSDPWDTGFFVLRPAPPAFVTKKSGGTIIIGVAGDDITPLTDDMNDGIEHQGILRVLPSGFLETPREFLTELGLIELSEKAWLKLPPLQTAADYIASLSRLWPTTPSTGAIEGIRIIDPLKPATYYVGRWENPGRAHTGVYVGRREQKYGAPLWCLVELAAGAPRRLVDLFSKGGRERPCDVAWRVQMAMDAMAGSPQRYRLHVDAPTLDFFSPLPSWAERKLAVVGEKSTPHGCLFSYRVAPEDID